MTLLNALLENEIFLEAWKIAKIKIIQKAGNRDWANPSSYRPISLLPIAGKIYERIIKNRLTSYLEENSLLSHNTNMAFELKEVLSKQLTISKTHYVVKN